MGGLSRTGTVLVAVFAFFLVGVTSQLAYVLWWRRRFRRQSVAGSQLEAFSSRGGEPAATPPPSKELLYFFFCLENKQSQIEPTTGPPPAPTAAPPQLDDAASKWLVGERTLLGPSRALFTIAEEERDGSVADGTTAAAPMSDHNRTAEIEENGSISLKEHLKGRDQEEEAQDVGATDENDVVDFGGGYLGEATPFSTPTVSPPYYTPSPSPVRDDVE